MYVHELWEMMLCNPGCLKRKNLFDCIVLAETAANERLIMLTSRCIDTDTEIDWIAYMQEVEGYEQVRFSLRTSFPWLK